jgi:hypothetical protein
MNREADLLGSIGWQVACARGNDAKRVQWTVVKKYRSRCGKNAPTASVPFCQTAKRFERRALHNTAVPAAQCTLGRTVRLWENADAA